MVCERRERFGILPVCFSVLFLFLLAPLAVAEGGWFIAATTMPRNSPPPSSDSAQVTLSVSQNKIKYETRAWAQIVNLKTQRLLLINHIGRTYWEGSLDAYLAAAAQQNREIRTQLEKALQQMSPEQRQRLERGGGPFDSTAADLEIAFTQTPEKQTIAGYDARKYVILRNGEPYEETWVAEKINVRAEVNQQRWQEFIRRLQEARTTPPGAVLAELTELVSKGYPVKTVNLLSNMTKQVVRAEKKKIPSAEFTEPQGYSQQALTEVMSLRRDPRRSSF